MGGVGAPKKVLSDRTRARLVAAVQARSEADVALWERCAEALQESSYEQVAAIAGVAKSTLQEKVRQYRLES